MPRLLRPVIPTSVRCRVALRQLGEMWPDDVMAANKGRLGALLAELLAHLAKLLGCEVKGLHLDHDPALGAREKVFRKGVHVEYMPPANDPDSLMYREANAHRVKTNHIGDHGQHPDRVLIKRQRRREKPPKPKRSSPIRSAGKMPKGKTKWASRPFPKKEKRR